MAKRNKKVSADHILKKLFQDFENEYLFQQCQSTNNFNSDIEALPLDIHQCTKQTQLDEIKTIKKFLKLSCSCGQSCQKHFRLDATLETRSNFRHLSWREKSCFILPLLHSFRVSSDKSKSARVIKERCRQKYVYRLNSDNIVCRDAFLFYYDISLKKLKYFQNHLNEVGIIPADHGHSGRKPNNSYAEGDREFIKQFVINYSAIHGLPDPGRDLRTGTDKLKIFLPSAMSYRSIHQIYLKSLPENRKFVPYQSFIRVWQEAAPNIQFQKPKTDLCKTCEDHIKNIRMATGRKNEDEKILYHKEAISHLKLAKTERNHYKDTIKRSQKVCQELFNENIPPKKIKSKNKFSMHYSWDFAQQLNYPYEDQQVGPIYFKTPRKAQLFGICCEAVPFQMNYLIDENDLLNKGANTVISFLDHFFKTHGLGESNAYLTADNCVGQNKNSPMIHYLLYRTIMGFHREINLSFMLVGHTKFAPDGYFGLIKRKYRKSNVYTYKHLVETIQQSSPNGHVLCQPYRNDSGKRNYEYYDWDKWLLKYFDKLPEIKQYHHFYFNKTRPGEIILKKTANGKEHTVNLLKCKKDIPDLKSSHPSPIYPKGLSLERQWYLYDKIRMHIPDEKYKDETCPMPNFPREKKKQ